MIDITGESIYNANIANINPFRYRGYYFDVETDFYYLNSRYYDPSLFMWGSNYRNDNRYSFSIYNSIISGIFGAIGGISSLTKLAKYEIKSLIFGIGLTFTENIFGEILEWIKSINLYYKRIG